MSELMRIATIGAGALSSRRIYPCFSMLPVDLVAVCDLDESKAKEAARKFGGRSVYTDYRAMLDKENIDAVIACVGPREHAELSQNIMRRGLPVYTEKPPAADAAGAAEVYRTSRETGQICMTAFKKRFAPVYKQAKSIICSETFGEPELLSIDYCSGPYSNDPANPRSLFLLDFAIHIIDLARYLLGEVVEVSAISKEFDTYAVNMRYESGALGVLAMSCRRSWKIGTEEVEITGSGSEFIGITNSTRLRHCREDAIVGAMEPNFSTSAGDSLIETGFMGELMEFVNAVKEKRQPESSIESSARTMILHDAIAQSAASGRPVRPDYSVLADN